MTAPGADVPVDRGTISLGRFEFECGRSIPELRVAYEAYGEFRGDNVVLVCHALTGSQHVADLGASDPGGDGDAGGSDDGAGGDGERDGPGDDADAGGDTPGVGSAPTAGQAHAWWGDVVGPGKAIDTTRYHVVCANVPGSCYGTSGPPTTNPETGEPYGVEFPPVTVADWTRAQRALLDALGVGRLHAVVGGSVGGMNVLEWGRRYPDDARRLVPVATAARLDPQCLALDAIARRAVRSDPAWNGGDYYGDDRPDPDRGLALARQVGHVMYLSKQSMAQKFGRRSAGRGARGGHDAGDGEGLVPPDPAADFFPYREVESYLDYQAGRFVDRFDANSYLYLSRAMDAYDLSAGHDSDADALAAFDGEALVVSFTGDWHFTVEASAALASAFRAANCEVAHHVVESDHGHDAFLVEPDRVGPPLRDFLADGVDGRAVTDALDGGGTGEDGEFAPVHTSLFSD